MLSRAFRRPDRGAEPNGCFARELECVLEQARFPEEAEPQSVTHCRLEVLWRKSRTGGVRDCSQRRRDTEAGLIGDVRGLQVGAVKDDAIMSLAKAARDCQMNFFWENVAQRVELQSRVVRNDAFRAAPQADQRQILVFR